MEQISRTACSVVFVAQDIFEGVGGIRRFNEAVARSLLPTASEVVRNLTVISVNDKNEFQLGVNAKFIPCGRSHWKLLRTLIQRLVRDRPDIIILGHINLAPLAPLSKLAGLRLRTALCVHGIEVWDDPRYRRRKFYEPLLLRSFIDTLISVSSFTAEIMSQRFDLGTKKIHLLPNSVGVDHRTSRPERYSSREDGATTLLSVCRLDAHDWEKGVATVIRAVSNLAGRLPKLQYVVVGDGILKAELSDLADSCGIGDRVLFLGSLTDEELESAYRNSDLFVLPSKKEGFGIVFLEAWKYGLPVICGNSDASPEVVVDGVSGLAVDPDDSDQLAEAIYKLVTDSAYAHGLALAGFERLRTFYTRELFQERLLGIIADQ